MRILAYLLSLVFILVGVLGDEKLDFYKILEIKKDATQLEIKKKFRALSLKYHPDKNPSPDAAEHFTKIAQAYDVLSDPEQRKKYDEFGHAGLHEGAGDQHHDPFDIFSMFGFGGQRQQRSRDVPKTPNTQMTLYVTLEQLYFGEIFNVEYSRRVVCGNSDECLVSRNDCQGPNLRVMTQQMGPGFFVQNQMRDESCIMSGKGWKTNCSACPNGQYEEKSTKLTAFVDAGMEDGNQVTFRGAGEQKTGHEAGDLVLVIKQIKHNVFERKGADLHMAHVITLEESLIGFSMDIKHMDKNPVHVKRTEVTPHGFVLQVPGKGMPSLTSGKGDLFITFSVQFPQGNLSEAAKSLIKKALQK